MNVPFHLTWKTFCLAGSLAMALFVLQDAAGAEPSDRPVILYSRYFNAEGETRYLPEGTYSEVLKKLRAEFDVQVHDKPLDETTLADVDVVLISNPSAEAIGDNPAPHHFSTDDIKQLTRFVADGGGLIVMGNQDDHNMEITATNQLLTQFGMHLVNDYTDVKSIRIPADSPIIGGLLWAYYIGDRVALDKDHRAKPRSLVDNDVSVKPLSGNRNHKGSLLAVSEPGKGRVVVVSDGGWLLNMVLSGEEVVGAAIEDNDNWEIFRRLAMWAAGR